MVTFLSIASLVWEVFQFVYGLFKKSPGQRIADKTEKTKDALKKARENRDVGDIERIFNGE